MGDLSPPPAHQATFAVGGVPGATAIEIVPVLFVPMGQYMSVLPAFMTTCVPVLERYAAGTARIDIGVASGARSILASWPSMPPRFAGSSRKNWPFFVTAA